jgi:amicoumacin kinase
MPRRQPALCVDARPGQRHCPDLVRGEADWIHDLRDKGVPAPHIHPSRQGRLVELAQVDGVEVAAFVQAKVAGQLMGHCDWSADLIERLGSLMARMHRAARSYRPSAPDCRLPGWSDWLNVTERAIHPSQQRGLDRCRELRSTLAGLGQSEATYGPIHDDLHGSNVLVGAECLVPIDFECAHCSWFLADIASALLFALWKTPRSDMEWLACFARYFLEHLSIGYAAAGTPLPFGRAEQDRVALFLKLRELSLYASDYGNRDLSVAGHEQDEMFAFMRRNVEDDVPYVSLE